MPLVDPPYPSFTRVVTKMYFPSPPPLDSSRLPSYRVAHVGRFHPYPRGPRRTTEAMYTPTSEYRTPLDPIAEEPEAIMIRPLTVYCDKGSDSASSLLSSRELEGPIVKDVSAEELNVSARPVIVLAVALKLFIRRTRYALLAMRVFHAGNKQ